MRPARWTASIWVLLAAVFAVPAHGDEPKPASVEELLDKVCADPWSDDHAAAALAARPLDDAIVAATKKRLEGKPRFHPRLALGYVLASHGEKQGLEILVDSLAETGHLGYVLLTRVAGTDFGWRRDGSSLVRWREWLAGFTEEEYRARVRRKRLLAEVRADGEKEFAAAAATLREQGDRGAAAAQFRAFALKFPRADAVEDALEIARLLDVEAKEDTAWREPASPDALAPPERIAWLVHHLRDARGRTRPLEGYCSVLLPPPKGAAAASNAAADLLKIGTPAIPTLLGLLEDRRPIRATGYSRRPHQRSMVLRYQDAALEILNELLPTPTYERRATAAYLSDAEPPERKALIADVRAWAADTAGKTPEELLWVGLRRSPPSEALEGLRRLSAEKSRSKGILEELRRLYDGGGSPLLRPSIVELMADLGDASRVPEVLRALDEGKFSMNAVDSPDDVPASIVAAQTAQRLRARFEKSGPAAPSSPDPAADGMK